MKVKPCKSRIKVLGEKFGRLKVVGFSHRIGYKKFWECLCDCGNTKIVYQPYLTAKEIGSCGCWKKENLAKQALERTIHGMRNTRFYGIWKGINGRCYVKSNKGYKMYGGRGIVSDWKIKFLDFKRDMYKSYLKHIQEFGEKNTTIERVDNYEGYSLANCKWATWREQNLNKRPFDPNKRR